MVLVASATFVCPVDGRPRAGVHGVHMPLLLPLPADGVNAVGRPRCGVTGDGLPALVLREVPRGGAPQGVGTELLPPRGAAGCCSEVLPRAEPNRMRRSCELAGSANADVELDSRSWEGFPVEVPGRRIQFAELELAEELCRTDGAEDVGDSLLMCKRTACGMCSHSACTFSVSCMSGGSGCGPARCFFGVRCVVLGCDTVEGMSLELLRGAGAEGLRECDPVLLEGLQADLCDACSVGCRPDKLLDTCERLRLSSDCARRKLNVLAEAL